MKAIGRIAIVLIVPAMVSGCAVFQELFGVTDQDMIAVMTPILNAVVDSYPELQDDSFSFPFDNDVVEFANADGSFVCSGDGVSMYQVFDNYNPPYVEFAITGELNWSWGVSGQMTDGGWVPSSVEISGELVVSGGQEDAIWLQLSAHGDPDDPAAATFDGFVEYGPNSTIEGTEPGPTIINNYLVYDDVREYALELHKYADN